MTRWACRALTPTGRVNIDALCRPAELVPQQGLSEEPGGLEQGDRPPVCRLGRPAAQPLQVVMHAMSAGRIVSLS